MSSPELKSQGKRKKRLEKFLEEYSHICRLYRVYIANDMFSESPCLQCEDVFLSDNRFQGRITNNIVGLRNSI
jgi:hypothetical protein